MRICIDGRTLSRQRTGIGRYVDGLVRALRDVDGDHERILLTQRAPRTSSGLGTVRVVGGGLKGPVWEQLVLPVALRALRADVFHIPHEGGPLVPSVRRFVATIFDLVPLRLPRLYLADARHALLYRLRLEIVRRRADAVITASEATKLDLQDLLGIREDRIWLTAVPPDPMFAPPAHEVLVERLRRLGVPRPYVLTVGSAEPRKNLAGVLAAYRAALEAEPEVPALVLVGADWRATHASELVRAAGLEQRAHVLGVVADEDLVALYAGASMFVYASTLEGYGLPVLEAMACGCPVVTSVSSSLPEVAHDAALLVDPHSPPEIARGIVALVRNGAMAASLRERGSARVRALSWTQTARGTLAAYTGAR